MLTTPTTPWSWVAPDSGVFDQTLPKTDNTGYTDYDGHNVCTTTSSIGLCSAGSAWGQHHTRRDEPVPKDFGVTRESISQQYISEFAILCFCDPTDADPAEGLYKTGSARTRQPV